MAQLLEKQRRFVHAYLIEPNAKKAAITAGYSPASAGQTGCELLKLPHVAEAIQKGLSEAEDRAGIELADLLRRMADALLADRSQAFGPDGEILPLDQWPDDLRNALQDVEVRELIGENGAKVGAISKLKFVSKEKAVAHIAKLKGLYAAEKVEHEVKVSDRLARARARARARGPK